MIDPELLQMLRCPETRQALHRAEGSLIESLNEQVGGGRLRNRAGLVVTEPFEDGLIRSDGKYLYPVRQDIPIMLIDEAIPLPV